MACFLSAKCSGTKRAHLSGSCCGCSWLAASLSPSCSALCLTSWCAPGLDSGHRNCLRSPPAGREHSPVAERSAAGLRRRASRPSHSAKRCTPLPGAARLLSLDLPLLVSLVILDWEWRPESSSCPSGFLNRSYEIRSLCFQFFPFFRS